jgi:hypothetical protein
MQQGTPTQARQLAVQRWAEIWPFDLDASAWESLFAGHHGTDILEAIRRTRHTRAQEPPAVFRSLLYWLSRLETERDEKANLTWPPSDVQN